MDQPAVLSTMQPAKGPCAETRQHQHTDNNRTDDWTDNLRCNEALDGDISMEAAPAQRGCGPPTAVLQEKGHCCAGDAPPQTVDSPLAVDEPTTQEAHDGSSAGPSTAIAGLGGISQAGVMSALAAALRQQQHLQQQPAVPAATAALSTAFTNLLDRAARMQRVAPAQLALAAAAMPFPASLQDGTHPHMLNSTQPQAPPVGSTADLLQLFQSLVSSTSVLQGTAGASAQASTAAPAQLAASAGPVNYASLLATQPVPRQLPQLRKLMLRRSSDSLAPADLSTASLVPGGNSSLAAASPGALAAAAALMGLKPLALPSARARAAGSAAVVPGVMKRKASTSLSTSPVCVLSPAGSAGLPDNIRPAAAAASDAFPGQVLSFQQPMQTQECFSSCEYLTAALPPGGGHGSLGQSRAIKGRTRQGNRLQQPSAWMDAELAATLAVYGDERAFPSSGTADATDDMDVDELLQRAAASARQHRQRVMQAAAAAAAGDSGAMYGAQGAEDEMDVDGSPEMAAAEALAEFADVEYRSSGQGSASAHLFSPHKAGPTSSDHSPSKRGMHFRKVMRALTGDAEEVPSEAEGDEATQLFSSQHQTKPRSAPAQSRRTPNKGVKVPTLATPDYSKRSRDAASAAAAALLAGSLVRQQGLYDGAAAAFDPAAPVDGQQIPHVLQNPQQQQQQEEFGIAVSPQPRAEGPAQQTISAADHEQGNRTPVRHKATSRVKKHEEEDEEEWQPRARPRGKAGAKPSPAKRNTPWLVSPAEDNTNDNTAAAAQPADQSQSPDGSPTVAPGRGSPVTAAGRTGRKGGGGKSATSGFRGVTQHRYTQRWEAHLWDPDGVRNKTAGSNRTRGTQTYLGGYHTEGEAARAYDRAALVYWGMQGFTNYPKEDYAGEMHLLSGLQREQVVTNIRSISHAMQRSALRQLAVMPHQALPGVYEARLYDEPVPGAPSTTYKYLGAYPTAEAAQQAVLLASQKRQLAQAAAQAAVADPDGTAAAAAVMPAAPRDTDGQQRAAGATNAAPAVGAIPAAPDSAHQAA